MAYADLVESGYHKFNAQGEAAIRAAIKGKTFADPTALRDALYLALGRDAQWGAQMEVGRDGQMRLICVGPIDPISTGAGAYTNVERLKVEVQKGGLDVGGEKYVSLFLDNKVRLGRVVYGDKSVSMDAPLPGVASQPAEPVVATTPTAPGTSALVPALSAAPTENDAKATAITHYLAAQERLDAAQRAVFDARAAAEGQQAIIDEYKTADASSPSVNQEQMKAYEDALNTVKGVARAQLALSGATDALTKGRENLIALEIDPNDIHPPAAADRQGEAALAAQEKNQDPAPQGTDPKPGRLTIEVSGGRAESVLNNDFARKNAAHIAALEGLINRDGGDDQQVIAEHFIPLARAAGVDEQQLGALQNKLIAGGFSRTRESATVCEQVLRLAEDPKAGKSEWQQAMTEAVQTITGGYVAAGDVGVDKGVTDGLKSQFAEVVRQGDIIVAAKPAQGTDPEAAAPGGAGDQPQAGVDKPEGDKPSEQTSPKVADAAAASKSFTPGI